MAAEVEIPRTMRVAVSPAPGCVEVVEQPVPAIGAGEALVRMEYCGLCGTDVSKVVAEHRAGPVALGHEVVGTVAATGAGVALAPGTRVVLAHHIPDYASHYTQRGSAPMDPHFKATNIDPCGFAEYIRAPAEHVRHTLLPLAPAFPPLRGVFVEPLACCLRALDRLALREGDTALLIGAGAAGLLFAPLLRDRAVTLLAADLRPERLALAEAWGAAKGLHVERDDVAAQTRAVSGGRGADLVILTVAGPEPWALATRALRDGGTLLLFGATPGATLPVDLYGLWRRELNVISSYGATPDLLPRALALLARPGWEIERTISHLLPLAEAPAAFALARAGQASKVVLLG
jgi:L-iditol 2-dehydrogenase